jgi:hypothetical protein
MMIAKDPEPGYIHHIHNRIYGKEFQDESVVVTFKNYRACCFEIEQDPQNRSKKRGDRVMQPPENKRGENTITEERVQAPDV